jgi:hypothetical protein
MIPRRVRLALHVVLALAATSAAYAQDATLRVDSTAGFRPILGIGAILDNETLREATASGIPIRLHVRVELWKDGFFDDLAGSRAWSVVLLYEPLGKEFLLRSSDASVPLRFASYLEARAAIERQRVIDLRPLREGAYYYTATLVIETLSLSDLEELERWLQGELQPAVSGDRSIPGAFGEGARRLVIRLLRLPNRRIEARSGRFEVGSLP